MHFISPPPLSLQRVPMTSIRQRSTRHTLHAPRTFVLLGYGGDSSEKRLPAVDTRSLPTVKHLTTSHPPVPLADLPPPPDILPMSGKACCPGHSDTY